MKYYTINIIVKHSPMMELQSNGVIIKPGFVTRERLDFTDIDSTADRLSTKINLLLAYAKFTPLMGERLLVNAANRATGLIGNLGDKVKWMSIVEDYAKIEQELCAKYPGYATLSHYEHNPGITPVSITKPLEAMYAGEINIDTSLGLYVSIVPLELSEEETAVLRHINCADAEEIYNLEDEEMLVDIG